MQQIRSNGKLMLTGEYLVLKGAKALAVPTKLGQSLSILPNERNFISWSSTVKNEKWFSVDFERNSLEIFQTTNLQIAEKLQEILLFAKSLNTETTVFENALELTANIEFEMEWGLGSSSSLVSNIAHWINCDPFELNRLAFHGSGYDIACARTNSPIVYRLQNGQPVVEQVSFMPSFSRQLFLVWLNQKQNTRNEINRFSQSEKYTSEIKHLNEVTHEIISSDSIEAFQRLLDAHEQLIAKVIQKFPVKTQLFPDFKGSIKSLGAWGGDFILVASGWPESDVKKYFKQKGFPAVFKYDEMIECNLDN